MAITQKCCEQYWTSSRGNTPQDTNYTATCLPSRKLSKLDEPDMQYTVGETGTSSQVMYSYGPPPPDGRAKAGRPARTYIQQLCEDTGCSSEDLLEVMNDWEKWRERVRDIRASGTIWWWWWWKWRQIEQVWTELRHQMQAMWKYRLMRDVCRETLFFKKIFTNGINMSLPQFAWVKKTVHQVETHITSGKEKIPGAAAVSKGGHANSFLGYERTYDYWFPWKSCNCKKFFLLLVPYTKFTLFFNDPRVYIYIYIYIYIYLYICK